MLIDSNNDQSIMSFLKLSQKEAQKFLLSEDKKYVLWKHNELIQKMPNQLKPNKTQQQAYTIPIISKLVQIYSDKSMKRQSTFPSMFKNFNNNAFIYEKQQINSHQDYSHSSNQQNSNLSQKNWQLKRENQNNNNENFKLTEQQKNNQQIDIPKKQKGELQNFLKQKRYSPFIHASKNFTDINSNSKLNFCNQNFIVPPSNSYNMLSLAQKKKVQAFSTDFSYPNTIMKGNIKNPFKNVFQQKIQGSKIIDIQNVMKYTLGGSTQIKNTANRQKSLNKKVNNPFIVVPQKYIKKEE